MTFEDAYLDWLTSENHRVRARQKRQISLDTDIHRLKMIRERWKYFTVDRITTDEITGYQADRLEAGKRPASVNSEIRSPKKVLKWAVKHRGLAEMPTYQKSFEDHLKRNSVPTEYEVSKLLAELHDFEANMLAKFLAQTRVRQGEAFHLIWDDIDFDKKKIHIGFRRDFRPKNSTSNRVLVPSDALLAELEKLNGIRKNNELVFPSKKNPEIKSVDFKKVLNTAANRAGIELRVTSQVLRRFYATRQAENNEPEHFLQTDLGHVIGSTVTKRYYTDVNDKARGSYRFDIDIPK